MSDLFHIPKSVNGARWRTVPIDDHAVRLMTGAHGVPELLARLLVARRIPGDQLESFLYPTLARDFPDPFALAGMKDAAQDVAAAVIARKTIGIFADFDVDGATSSALLTQFFRALDIPTILHIPDRINEGYGPNTPALLKLQEKGCALSILCDCGITAHDVLAPVADAGFPVIVLDHHEPEKTLPRAAHIVNPKRADDTSGYTMLAAVGVTFLFCVAINKILRDNGFYHKGAPAEPPLKDYLDLVALGTLCDMVPLVGANRVLVRYGLSRLNARTNIGIQALARVAKINDDDPITTMQVGFGLGPRINAGSRVHQADLGSKLLSATDPVEALRLAEILDDCNIKRRELEQATVEHALRKVVDQGLDQDPVILVDDPDWHPGVAGLVATRLKDRFGKPACVVTYAQKGDGTREARGSGRSIPGFNIATLFQGARAAGHLIKGGGHAMAGGFSLRPDQWTGFVDYVRHAGQALAANIDPTPERLADGVASVRAVNVNVARILNDDLGPYGPGHDEPLFILPQVRIGRTDILGNAHIRSYVSDWEGGTGIKAMAFRQAETDLGQMLRGTGDQPIHLLGHVRVDRWQGRETPVFFIQDAARVDLAATTKTGAAA